MLRSLGAAAFDDRLELGPTRRACLLLVDGSGLGAAPEPLPGRTIPELDSPPADHGRVPGDDGSQLVERGDGAAAGGAWNGRLHHRPVGVRPGL